MTDYRKVADELINKYYNESTLRTKDQWTERLCELITVALTQAHKDGMDRAVEIAEDWHAEHDDFGTGEAWKCGEGKMIAEAIRKEARK